MMSCMGYPPQLDQVIKYDKFSDPCVKGLFQRNFCLLVSIGVKWEKETLCPESALSRLLLDTKTWTTKHRCGGRART
jgi:hypothetical protein